MSGIAGIYRLDGRPVDPHALNRMAGALAHRGPDHQAAWADGPLGLAQCLLHTTEESLYERLPLHTGPTVLVADARLDNREALLGQLSRSGQGVVPDAALIAAAYARWGPACVEHLLGDFAFALWDGARQVLFAARDGFGVRPLYYHHAPGRVFLFASEVKALLRIEEVPVRLNELRIAEHLLVPVPADSTRTFYQDIYSLAPGHSLTIGPTGLRTRCYWKLEPTRELRLSSDEAYAEAFRELFTEAVRCRLRSAFPIGSMLSGGLDSSSVTCVAARLLARQGARRLHTFSAIYEQVPTCDERPYIDSVLTRYDLEPHYFQADAVSPLADWERVLLHMDRPNAAGNLYINWNLYKPASEHGVRVLLDGFDGDTTVSHGIPGSFYELRQAERWLTLISEVKAFATRNGEPWRPAVLSWIIGPLLSKTGLLALRRTWRSWTREAPPAPPPPAWRHGLNEDFAREIAGHIPAPLDLPKTEREHHYRRLTRPLLSQTLELLSAASAPFSIEVRFPFFDRRLVNFCLSLPAEQKVRHGWTRLVMRRGMSGILPEKVRWRGGKSNLGPGFNHALVTFEQHRLKEMVQQDLGEITRYCDPGFLQTACDDYLARGTAANEVFLWRALSLALWLQQVRPSPEHPQTRRKEVMHPLAP